MTTNGRIRPGKDQYSPDDPDAILRHAKRLKGLTVQQVHGLLKEAGLRPPRESPKKPTVGRLVETWFGLSPSNESEPDFPQSGVELKTLPLKRTKKGRAVKEPTSVQMIDYFKLIEEDWATASVRKKLGKVLFVVWEVNDEEFLESRFLHAMLWSPKPIDDEVFKQDWHKTRDIVDDGRAHELSERIAKVLGPRRKGASGEMRRQPKSPHPAKSRAFALKAHFTRQIVDAHIKKAKFESVADSLKESDPDLLEVRILDHLGRLENRRLGDIAEDYNIPLRGGKSMAASIMKKAMGFKNVNSRVEEFDRYGISVKVIPVRTEDQWPLEAVSFPTMSLKEFSKEDWESAALQEHLQRILFIPTYLEKRGIPQEDRMLGHAFFWSPSEEQWQVIEEEWRMYQQEIKGGKAAYREVKTQTGGTRRRTGLTPASQTRIIHLRPHGKDSHDTDIDPKGNVVTKQCFWLNQRFVQSLIISHSNNGPPEKKHS